MTPESDLDLDHSGPFYRLQERIGLIRNGVPIPSRIAWAIALTWVPLLILSFLQGRALGPTPRESFLLDFAAHARFLVSVPLLLLAERVVNPRLMVASGFFVRSGLVRVKDAPVYDGAVARLRAWRDSAWAEAVLLGVALIASWTLNFEKWYMSGLTWRTLPAVGGAHWSLAGLWFHAVALPVFQFLWLRWLWRLALWTRFIYTMSRLDLNLVATHPDGVGGLGFAIGAHSSLGILACALGCPFSGDVAFRLLYEGAKLSTFEVPLAVYLIATVAIFLSPTLVFSPVLARARREGLRAYSLLVDDYNRAFHEKWVAGRHPESEPLLGSADIQSLADLGSSYDRVKAMKSFPIGRKLIAAIVGPALLPGLPLVLIVVPVVDILKFLGKAIF